MKAISVKQHGGPEVLELVEADSPTPGPGQLLVDVAAAGVNFYDVYEREAIGSYARPLPYIPGSEGAGVVAAVGENVGEFAAGDRIAWAAAPGSYAEQVLVAADKAVAIPAAIDLRIAAAVLLQGMTAHYLATSAYPVESGDVCVVHAAAGGVGLLLTQIIKLRGGTVIATTGAPEKAELARQSGAGHVAGYEDFGETVALVTGKKGARAVFDGVGQATFDQSLACLARRGYLVLYGGSSGQVPPFDLQRLNTGGSLYVTRPKLGDYTETRAELLERANDLFGWIERGKLTVRIGNTYPLAQTRQAHRDLEERKTTGKLLLLPE